MEMKAKLFTNNKHHIPFTTWTTSQPTFISHPKSETHSTLIHSSDNNLIAAIMSNNGEFGDSVAAGGNAVAQPVQSGSSGTHRYETRSRAAQASGRWISASPYHDRSTFDRHPGHPLSSRSRSPPRLRHRRARSRGTQQQQQQGDSGHDSQQDRVLQAYRNAILASYQRQAQSIGSVGNGQDTLGSGADGRSQTPRQQGGEGASGQNLGHRSESVRRYHDPARVIDTVRSLLGPSGVGLRVCYPSRPGEPAMVAARGPGELGHRLIHATVDVAGSLFSSPGRNCCFSTSTWSPNNFMVILVEICGPGGVGSPILAHEHRR